MVSNIHGKETLFSLQKKITELFKNSSDHRKLALKDKLQNIMMQKNDTIPQYLSMFTQVRDELGGVGVNVAEDYLVSLNLISLPKSWFNNIPLNFL